jgi:hypothetical protein
VSNLLRPRRRRTIVLITVVAAVLLIGAVTALVVRIALPTASEAQPTEAPMPTIRVTPAPTPTPTGPPPNTNTYDTAGLPSVDVFAVISALPLDTDPFGTPTGLVATPSGEAAPVFADPTAEPVARLASQQVYGGAVVPVVEKYDDWVKVLLVGRESLPPEGSSAQVSGWMRTSDVTISPQDAHVEVSLSARTIDIVTPAGSERIATDFGSGATDTPTPVGRAFVMMTRTVPEFSYTRGHPLVYLSVQSPTLAGFAGADVAITAFHYHDARSGAISNGCLRVAPDAIERLAQLPEGTVVYVHP